MAFASRRPNHDGYDSAAFKPAVVDTEYEKKVKSLSQMLTKTKDEMDAVKAMADELKGIKLAKPTSGGPINRRRSRRKLVVVVVLDVRWDGRSWMVDDR